MALMRLLSATSLPLLRTPLASVCRRGCHEAGIARKAAGEVDIELSNGRVIKLSTGKLARFADGSCVGQSGNTSVMVTAVSKTKSTSGYSFTPLTVDYRQKAAAAGRIPTNFLRRELGPTEKEILTSRVIDRSLRPLFPAGYFYETQLVCNLLAVDGVNDPDVLSINAASAALCVSDIPWDGPVGAVRVGMIGDDVLINPTRREMSLSKLDMIVSGTESKHIVMMEGSATEPILHNYMLKSIKCAVKEIHTIIRGIKKLQKAVNKPKREVEKYFIPNGEQMEAVKVLAGNRLTEALTNYTHDKMSRDEELTGIRQDVLKKLRENFPEEDAIILQESYNAVVKSIHSKLTIGNGKRCDGRTSSELRPIDCEVNLYKPLHGSALFQRGQTQVLCSVALDSHESAFKSDPMSIITGGMKEKNFMLHYEFPAFATKEVGRSGAPGRREMGHGALAEKGLRPVLPDSFPFTVRLNCEVLESNGSSSMASVCAGSLALMDAGVPITEPVAGVAIGLLTSEEPVESLLGEKESDVQEKTYQLLTDILGIEDYLGEMDFKVAGTRKGYTALQLDVKVRSGVPSKVLMDALQRAHDAKIEILNIMKREISEPRKEEKDNWPVSKKLEVPVHKRSKLLGPGGYNVKKLTSETGVQMNQDQDDVNSFVLFAPNQEAMNEANEFISSLLEDDKNEPQLDFGGIYTAKIVEIRDNGVMVTLYPNMKPTLLHVRELDQRKVSHPSALNFEVDHEVQVKYFGRDPSSGHIRISRRVLQMTNAKAKNLIENGS